MSKCKSNSPNSQARNDSPDLTLEDACKYLNRSPDWLRRKRDEFQYYKVPGRGRPADGETKGGEYRFTLSSLQAYRRRLLRATKKDGNPYRGKKVAEIASIVNNKNERETEI